jgi:aspartyl-tRNA(Asn)/glutamyl-tRNA(Gln) amidotransferase subunit B
VLTASRELADYYEATVRAARGEAKLCANWVMGDLAGALNRSNLEITASPVTGEQLAGMVRRIVDGTITGKIAKEVFEAMWAGEGDADAVIDRRGLRQVSDTGAIEGIVGAVMAANPAQVAEYRAGKEKLLGFFVGQVMKASQGKVNPQQLDEVLRRKLAGG